MTRLLARLTCLALLAPLAAGVTSAAAQDTSQVKEGIRVGLDYQPGIRPGLVVLPGAGLDSAARHRRPRSRLHRPLPVDRPARRRPRPTAAVAPRRRRQLRDLQDARRRVRGRVDRSGRWGHRPAARLERRPGSQSAELHACRPPRTPATGSRCTAWPTRWRAGPPARPASRPAASCSCRAAGSTASTATARRSRRSRRPGRPSLSPAWSPDGRALRVHAARGRAGRGRGAESRERRDAAGAGHGRPGSTSRRRSRPTDGCWPTRTPTRTAPTFISANVVDRCCAQRLTVGRYRGQLISNVFTRWQPHRVRFHARGTAANLRHGHRRDRSGAAGAVRLRRDRQLQRTGVVP